MNRSSTSRLAGLAVLAVALLGACADQPEDSDALDVLGDEVSADESAGDDASDLEETAADDGWEPPVDCPAAPKPQPC